MIAEIVATSYDRDAAPALYEALLPYRDRLLCVVLGLACMGSADRYLGVLAGLIGNDDVGDAHFARAIELETRVRGRALLPRTRYWQARTRFDRDPASARDMLTTVASDAAQLGMQRLQAQAEELLAR